MDARCVFVLAIFACSYAAPTTTSTPLPFLPAINGGLEIKANADEFFPLLTREVVINCTMDMKNHPPPVASLVSLVIHSWNQAQNDFKALALVSSFNPDHVIIHDDVHAAAVTGHLDPTGLSYLTLKWTRPVREVEGRYKCESNGMTIFGRPDTSVVSLRLSAMTPDSTSLLVDMISELQDTVKNLMDTVVSQDVEIAKLTNTTQTQKDALKKLTKTVLVQDNEIDKLTSHAQLQNEKINNVTHTALDQDAKILEQDAEIQNLTARIRNQELITHNQTEHLGDQTDAICSLKSQVANYSGLVYPLPYQCPAPMESCRDVQGTEQREVAVLEGGMAVLCDTVTDGGGWIVFQRRSSGQVDFDRPWIDYQNGFGDLTNNFWLGNDRLYRITIQGKHEMRVDIVFNNHSYYARYGSFKVHGPETNYRIEVSSYSGTAGDSLTSTLQSDNNMPFSTYDAEHDSHVYNCAKNVHIGGWWYNKCGYSALNGRWNSTERNKGVFWYDTTTRFHSASFTEMKIRPI